MEFGQIPREDWFQPDSIDEIKATASRNEMMENNIIYGGSVSYRNMCRFNSGVRQQLDRTFLRLILFRQFFFKHPLMSKYRWYWRIECVNLNWFTKISSLSSPPLDLTSNFTVTFYMTRLYIWKNKRRFIVSSVCPCPSFVQV
jgi:Glycolipid 2-alpha-mannosyltransferase